jgi:CheY-like chemotaxis protein
MTAGLQRRDSDTRPQDGLAQMSTARSNRQTVNNPRHGGVEQLQGTETEQRRLSDAERRRESSETPELGQVENGRIEKGPLENGKREGTCTGSGPSGMDTERGHSSGQDQQGCVGSSGNGQGPKESAKQEGSQQRAVNEVTQTVAKAGLEDGKAADRNADRNVEVAPKTEMQEENVAEGIERERRAPPKVYLLESSDEDEADVDDEEGGGLDEVDDLDGSWQANLPSKHLRVLLVEDDDCTRHVVAALLRNCGYEGAWNAMHPCTVEGDGCSQLLFGCRRVCSGIARCGKEGFWG